LENAGLPFTVYTLSPRKTMDYHLPAEELAEFVAAID
jgi:hypothetical protein